MSTIEGRSPKFESRCLIAIAFTRRLVLVLCGMTIVPVAFCAWDYATAASGSLGKGISLALLAASAGAFALTTVPALVVVRRWPVPALILVLLYPAAWIGIMSQL